MDDQGQRHPLHSADVPEQPAPEEARALGFSTRDIKPLSVSFLRLEPSGPGEKLRLHVFLVDYGNRQSEIRTRAKKILELHKGLLKDFSRIPLHSTPSVLPIVMFQDRVAQGHALAKFLVDAYLVLAGQGIYSKALSAFLDIDLPEVSFPNCAS